jgi:hypothetical protein
MTKSVRLAAVAVLATILAGCGPATQTASPGTGSLGGIPTSTPASGAAGGAGAGSGSATPAPDDTAPVLPDGRSPVIIKSVDVAKGTITFDLVELYLGLQAAVEWKKDNPGQVDMPALNGHYMRNNNPKLRTLPVSANVVVNVLDNQGDPDPTTAIAFDDLPTYLGMHGGVFWITVKGGNITRFEEQFFP